MFSTGNVHTLTNAKLKNKQIQNLLNWENPIKYAKLCCAHRLAPLCTGMICKLQIDATFFGSENFFLFVSWKVNHTVHLKLG